MASYTCTISFGVRDDANPKNSRVSVVFDNKVSSDAFAFAFGDTITFVSNDADWQLQQHASFLDGVFPFVGTRGVNVTMKVIKAGRYQIDCWLALSPSLWVKGGSPTHPI